MAVNIPAYSTNYGAKDGNKTLPIAVNFDTRKGYKRETNLMFSEGTVDQYEIFRSQFNIHQKMLDWDTKRAGIELYMSLEGNAGLKIKEGIMNAMVRLTTPKCGMPWIMLFCLSIIVIQNMESLPRDNVELVNVMTEYMDELICLFRKARPGSPESFQNEEVKNKLLAGLPFEVMEIVAGYLDLTADEIARKFDVIASQREALGLMALGPTDKPLLVIQEKQSGNDDSIAYREFEEVFAFRDGNR